MNETAKDCLEQIKLICNNLNIPQSSKILSYLRIMMEEIDKCDDNRFSLTPAEYAVRWEMERRRKELAMKWGEEKRRKAARRIQ